MPVRITCTMPLRTRRSSMQATPSDSGEGFGPRHLRVREPEQIINAAHLRTEKNDQIELAESLSRLIGPTATQLFVNLDI